MNSSTLRGMIAAAALTVVAASASAQTYKAEVPLSFRAGKTAMAPGSYQFETVMNRTGNRVIQVRNTDTNQAVMLLAAPTANPRKAWRETGKPVIAFECVSGTCALHQLWDGQDTYSYQFATPKLPRGEISMAVIPMTPVKSE